MNDKEEVERLIEESRKEWGLEQIKLRWIFGPNTRVLGESVDGELLEAIWDKSLGCYVWRKRCE